MYKKISRNTFVMMLAIASCASGNEARNNPKRDAKPSVTDASASVAQVAVTKPTTAAAPKGDVNQKAGAIQEKAFQAFYKSLESNDTEAESQLDSLVALVEKNEKATQDAKVRDALAKISGVKAAIGNSRGKLKHKDSIAIYQELEDALKALSSNGVDNEIYQTVTNKKEERRALEIFADLRAIAAVIDSRFKLKSTKTQSMESFLRKVENDEKSFGQSSIEAAKAVFQKTTFTGEGEVESKDLYTEYLNAILEVYQAEKARNKQSELTENLTIKFFEAKIASESSSSPEFEEIQMVEVESKDFADNAYDMMLDALLSSSPEKTRKGHISKIRLNKVLGTIFVLAEQETNNQSAKAVLALKEQWENAKKNRELIDVHNLVINALGKPQFTSGLELKEKDFRTIDVVTLAPLLRDLYYRMKKANGEAIKELEKDSKSSRRKALELLKTVKEAAHFIQIIDDVEADGESKDHLNAMIDAAKSVKDKYSKITDAETGKKLNSDGQLQLAQTDLKTLMDAIKALLTQEDVYGVRANSNEDY